MSESPNILSGSARHRARRGENGMGLLELVIAMTVLTVGLMGSMVMIVTGMESNSRNKTDNAATILDQEILEMFATLNNYPKSGSVTITDCALSTGNANQLCSAKIRWGRRIMYFQGFQLPKVSLRIVAQVSITP